MVPCLEEGSAAAGGRQEQGGGGASREEAEGQPQLQSQGAHTSGLGGHSGPLAILSTPGLAIFWKGEPPWAIEATQGASVSHRGHPSDLLFNLDLQSWFPAAPRILRSKETVMRSGLKIFQMVQKCNRIQLMSYRYIWLKKTLKKVRGGYRNEKTKNDKKFRAI